MLTGRDSRRVFEALVAKGHDIRSQEVAGAWGVSSWRAEYDDVLEALYPLRQEDR